VARIYAGVFGLVAFVTVLARGLIRDADPESILSAAWCSLLLFTAIGYALGWIAGKTVDDSVRASIAAEVAARRGAPGKPELTERSTP